MQWTYRANIQNIIFITVEALLYFFVLYHVCVWTCVPTVEMLGIQSFKTFCTEKSLYVWRCITSQCLKVRNWEVFQKCIYAQTKTEWTWSIRESLLLLVPVALVGLAFIRLRVRIFQEKPQLNMQNIVGQPTAQAKLLAIHTPHVKAKLLWPALLSPASITKWEHVFPGSADLWNFCSTNHWTTNKYIFYPVFRTVARKFPIGGLDTLKIDKHSTDL